jgi:hypothetical protein
MLEPGQRRVFGPTPRQEAAAAGHKVGERVEARPGPMVVRQSAQNTVYALPEL